MKSLIITFLSIMTFSLSAQTDSYEKLVFEMFEVSGAKASYEASLNQMQAMLGDMELDPELVEQMKGESIQKLYKRLVPVYQKHYSEDDLKEIIAWYKLPAGQKIVKHQADIMTESMIIGQQWGMEIGQEFYRLKGK